ncbi:MAG: aminopeptidase [Lactobacillales bacterium]|jgi:aminopeptidase|nr:aminopeptidase [Lactobacillales bacterium]
MTLPNFKENLRKYAQLMIKYGINVQPGQVVELSLEITQGPLGEALAEEAYIAGADEVLINWINDTEYRLMMEYSSDEKLSQPPHPYQFAKRDYLLESDYASVGVISGDPAAFASIPPEKFALRREAYKEFGKPMREKSMGHHFPWTIVVAASPEQAALVFPELATEEEQVDALWDALFAATRVYEADPIAAWKKHIEFTSIKAKELNDAAYDSLHYYSDETDLTIGLPKGHIWTTALATADNGKEFISNIPSEEVWTAPDNRRINGHVASTKPLVYNGSVIEGLKLTFKDGQVIDFSATKGLDVLEVLLESEGAKSLGEVALVPHDSPISNTGLVFYETLFDENASCHLALGDSYSDNLTGGSEMSEEELAEHGLNSSQTHSDFMVGSAKLNIDALKTDGTVVPLFRDGNWA